LLERAGEIMHLKRQVKYELIPKQEGERACHYIADFVYYEKNPDGKNYKMIVEDCKGFKTDVYRLKKKLFQWRYGVKILET
jgi:hypothetical protein